jgi:hypothetical protein
MKTKILTSTFLAAAVVAIGLGFAAQRSLANRTPQDQTTQSQVNSGMMGGGMMGQGQGMTGMMGRMTTHHQQMSGLMTKLMQSMSAIQSEKDPEALRSKLAEHQVLLNQMHSQMMQQGNTMQMMSGQVKQYCPAAGDAAKSPSK